MQKHLRERGLKGSAPHQRKLKFFKEERGSGARCEVVFWRGLKKKSDQSQDEMKFHLWTSSVAFSLTLLLATTVTYYFRNYYSKMNLSLVNMPPVFKFQLYCNKKEPRCFCYSSLEAIFLWPPSIKLSASASLVYPTSWCKLNNFTS